MVLKFKVYEQTISLQSTKSEPRQGSKDYLELQFSFSSDWNGLSKYVYLQHGEVSVPHDLVEESIIVDEYFTEQTEFNVTLLGKSADGSVEVPTNVVTVFLKESNNLWEKDAPEPQNSWVVQVVDARDEALAYAIRAENAAIHQPYPNEETGTWWVWNADSGAYTDTGVSVGSSITVDSELSDNSENPVQNKVIKSALDALSEEIANLQTSGLTTEQINALDGMFKVCAFTKADVSAEYTAFKTAFGISEVVTLSSISVTYNGGDVAVGTAVTALDGVVVTAIYSDGSTEIATGYTISGTIAEGQNTVTVTYQGKTATFTVTGVAESSGGGESGETGVSNESTWTDGVAYTFNPVKDTYIESNGAETAYNTWSSSPYLYCDGASQLVFTVLLDSSMLSANNNYNAFYDENKTFISNFSIAGIGNASIDGAEIGATKEITIPENAAYFRVSHKDGVYGNIDSDDPILSITPKA